MLKNTFELFEDVLDSLTTTSHFFLTCCMGIIANVGTITAIAALIVILFQLRVALVRAKIKTIELKLKRMEYDKECNDRRMGE